MIKDICFFQRIEKKYKVTLKQREELLGLIGNHLTPDAHGKNSIRSLYLDTPSHLLIRNSINGKTYKEKLRLRSYGTPGPEDQIFFELKKKYKGVVYKRRVSMTLEEAQTYINEGVRPFNTQVMAEIDYAMKFYDNPKPAMLISCDREAYFAKDWPNLRITFDSNICYQDRNFAIEPPPGSNRVLPENLLILEIKTDGAMPLWLSEALDDLKIKPTSFSKYGTAYREIISRKKDKGVKENVNII